MRNLCRKSVTTFKGCQPGTKSEKKDRVHKGLIQPWEVTGQSPDLELVAPPPWLRPVDARRAALDPLGCLIFSFSAFLEMIP